MSSSRRLSGLFSFKSASGRIGAPSDAGSVTSEYTGSTDSPGEYRRRNSISNALRLTESIDDDVDNIIRNLYEDPDILERKCQLSIQGKLYTEAEFLLSGKSLESPDSSKSQAGLKNLVDISDKYYELSFDPVLEIIHEVASWECDEKNQMFMSKIEKVDAAKDIIIDELFSTIEDNYEDLMACMRNIHAIDLDISTSAIQMSIGRRKLQIASDMLSVGPIKIATAKHKRDQLLSIAETVRSLKFIKDLHKAMLTHIVTGDLGRAAEYARSVLKAMNHECYDKFTALAGIKESVRRHILVIRQKTDKALMRLCCRKFAPAEYSNIVRAYQILDELAETMGETCIETKITDSLVFDNLGGLTGLSSRVQRYQFEDLNNCLQTAILEFIYANQQKKQKAAAALDINIRGAYSQMNASEMMDLAEVPLEELYILIKPELVAPCIIRSCELFTDVIHTHYLITQWHLTPFDERSVSMEFLHRSKISLDNSSDIEDIEEGEGFDSKEGQEDTVQEDNVQLTRAYGTLCTSRTDLWNELLDALVDMLNRIPSLPAVIFEDFLAIKWAIHAMITLGDEFCGSACASLHDCLQEKTREFFARSQGEAFQVLRQITEAELWSAVPVSITESGGILGILKSKISSVLPSNNLLKLVFRAERAGITCIGLKSLLDLDLINGASNAYSSPIHSIQRSRSWGNEEDGRQVCTVQQECAKSSILMAFASYGNPFHFMTSKRDHEHEEENEDNDPVAEEEAMVGIGGLYLADDPLTPASPITVRTSPGHTLASPPLTPVSSSSSSSSHYSKHGGTIRCHDMGDYITMLFEEDSSTNKAKTSEDSVIVTQSALNGLARYAAKYLQMMYMMQASTDHFNEMSIAVTVFQGLSRLFDFYFCFVFNSFVSPEEKQKLFAKPSKMSLPAPDQARDYEAVLLYLDSTLNETVYKSDVGMALAKSADINYSSSNNDLRMSTASTSSTPGTNTNGTSNSSTNSTVGTDSVKFCSLLREVDTVDFGDAEHFFGMSNKVVAAESCWFASKIFAEIKGKVLKALPASDAAAVVDRTSQFQRVAGQMRSLIYRSFCPQLIRQTWLLAQIADHSAWDSKKLRESHHDWVDTLADYFEEVWEVLSSSDGFLDALVREQVWMELCQCAFDALLEGFAKVRKVSAEGRAAMIMDIASLHDGIDNIHGCRPPRGKHHLNGFVAAAGMPEDEMLLTWIRENWQVYSYRHIHGLLTQTLGHSGSNKRFKDAVAMVDALYDSNVHTNASATGSSGSGFNSQNSLSPKQEDGSGTFIGKLMRRQSVALR